MKRSSARNLVKAQKLVKLFIQRLRDCHNNPDQAKEIFTELKQINSDYKQANGGGDLFKVTNSECYFYDELFKNQ